MPVSPFVLHVARLRRQSGSHIDEHLEGLLDEEGILASSRVGESGVPEGAIAVVDAALDAFVGGVMVAVTLRTAWIGWCRRCGASLMGELTASMRERFCEPGGHYADPDDEESYRIVEDTLDLRPMLREAVALELPLAPLCRAECAGLCPICGADRNTERCECALPTDPRWSALGSLAEPPAPGSGE